MATNAGVEEKAKSQGKEETKGKEGTSEVKPEVKQEATQESKKEATSETKSQGKSKADVSPKLQQIIEAVEKLTVMELARLVKALEEKFGVSAQAVALHSPVGAVSGAAQAGGGVEEKTSFQVILASAGDKKIQVIKEIRTVTSLGLKEAKELVESAPKLVKDNATKEEADKIKAALEAAGAKIEIK